MIDTRTEKIEQIKTRLINEIEDHYPDWDCDSLKIAGYGVENAVFSVASQERGLIAIRVPWERHVSNENDGELDSRYQLKKEAEIAKHCFAHGLPVPEVVTLHLGENIDFLTSKFVKGDAKPLSSFDIGRLAAQLHHIPSDGLETVDSRQISKILSERITKRADALRRVTSSTFLLPQKDEIESILKVDDYKRSLLHMDIRPANFIGRNGQIQAIVDWNNALIGSPVLDVMRVLETAEVNEKQFLEGYNNDKIIDRTPEIIQALYRLDTAIMLAVLFHYYVKDAEKAEYYYKRVIAISEKIHSE